MTAYHQPISRHQLLIFNLIVWIDVAANTDQKRIGEKTLSATAFLN